MHSYRKEFLTGCEKSDNFISDLDIWVVQVCCKRLSFIFLFLSTQLAQRACSNYHMWHLNLGVPWYSLESELMSLQWHSRFFCLQFFCFTMLFILIYFCSPLAFKLLPAIRGEHCKFASDLWSLKSFSPVEIILLVVWSAHVKHLLCKSTAKLIKLGRKPPRI